MITLKAIGAAPFALASWAGLAGRDEEPSARILVYHGTPAREAAMLERQLRWLKRRFEIVPLRTLSAAARGGAVGRMVALTFDDGLRNNIAVAYPILRKLEIPATFFVCPGLIDRGAWLWTHEARRRLARLGASARAWRRRRRRSSPRPRSAPSTISPTGTSSSGSTRRWCRSARIR